MDPELADRLAAIESLLAQLLQETRARRRTVAKRQRSVHERAFLAAQRETVHVPTEQQIEAARKKLRNYALRDDASIVKGRR